MSVLLLERAVEQQGEIDVRESRQSRRRSWVGTVIRVGTAEGFVGQILLDRADRVRAHADCIPSDVVLKVLVQHTRHGDACGKLTGRKDGRTYFWHVIGAEGL
jgi:hypothetical protein